MASPRELLKGVKKMALKTLNDTVAADMKILLNKMNSTAQKIRLGTLLEGQKGCLRCTYDFAVQGGAVGTVDLVDPDGNDATLPDNAIITRVFIDEVTNVTSGGAATIAIGANTTTDLLGATAIASFTGIIAGVPDDAVGNMVKLTADRTLTATIATAAVTAGKLEIFVEYVLST